MSGSDGSSDIPEFGYSEVLPKHIAVIMDGNGRWAKARGLPRVAGHKQGAEAARKVVKAAADLGVSFITLFGFSSENWARPADEVKELMNLLRHYLRGETAELHKNNAVLRVIGDRAGLDDDIVELIENAEALTRDNSGITVLMALNYGGRDDILQAAQKAAEKAVALGSAAQVRDDFEGFLMTAGVPDPDLLIRTSGEQRISNFLLWQCAYAEFVYTDTLWPDFGRDALTEALAVYSGRERRFGGVDASSAWPSKG